MCLCQPMAPVPDGPLVSCTMITLDRVDFVHQALAHFDAQHYPHRELVVVDDGNRSVEMLCHGRENVRYIGLGRPLPLGAKRNLACAEARGEWIAHWDDDDWHAPWRLSNQVRALLDGGVLCGLPKVVFYDPLADQAWLYRYAGVGGVQWLAGGTFFYRRDFWQAHPFDEAHFSGEDNAFFARVPAADVVPLHDESIFIALMHGGNIRRRSPDSPAWTDYPVERVHERLGPAALEAARRNCRAVATPPPEVLSAGPEPQL